MISDSNSSISNDIITRSEITVKLTKKSFLQMRQMRTVARIEVYRNNKDSKKMDSSV